MVDDSLGIRPDFFSKESGVDLFLAQATKTMPPSAMPSFACSTPENHGAIVDLLYAGCIPLIIADDSFLPFESILRTLHRNFDSDQHTRIAECIRCSEEIY